MHIFFLGLVELYKRHSPTAPATSFLLTSPPTLIIIFPLRVFLSNMQSIIVTLLCGLGLAAAGLTQGSYQSQYVEHSHAAVTSHVASPIQVVRAVPSVQVLRAAPTLYKTAVLPTAYASTYSYRAPPAKILNTLVHHQPIVYAAPKPVVLKTVAVPTSYASTFSYRAPAAKLVVPVYHASPIVHHAAPVYHAAPIVHHAVAHPVLLH